MHKSLLRYSDFCVFVLVKEEVKLVDLGHDDVDGQECKDGRSRTWMLLLYEDDPSHKAVLDGKLSELDWNYAGIKHDSDDGVKVHHHIVVLFKDGRKNADIANDLGIDKRWLRAWDRKKRAFRYLCHRDNQDKFQYSTESIYGTVAEQAVSACSKGNELSEVQAIKEIADLLDSIDGTVTYSFFLRLVADRGLYSVFRRLGIIATRLLDEHNGIERTKIQREISREHNVDRFVAFMKSIDNMPFEDKCKLLIQKGFPIDPM